jgi:hypothetical protein
VDESKEAVRKLYIFNIEEVTDLFKMEVVYTVSKAAFWLVNIKII